jgi:galactose mutarotase-like enzyme
MYTISNGLLQATIQGKGAELSSLIVLATGHKYMWPAGSEWPKHSPVLFPIVGTLKQNTYYFNNKAYQLPRHGFARDKNFVVTAQDTDNITLQLQEDDTTLAVYPFPFRFNITYRLLNNSLEVTYHVQNPGEDTLYFSVGGHPAFQLPMTAGTVYNDYYLQFNKLETTGRWPISPDGLIEKEPLPLLNNTDRLPLDKTLFAKDALVLKNLQSDSVTLASDKTGRSITFSFPGFDYLGLWAAKGADFICIEPWCGIADSVDSNQQLTDKEGIQSLRPKDSFSRTWSALLQ